MTINDYLIKLSTSPISFGKPLELGKEIELKVRGTVVQERHNDLNNGEIDIVYIVKGEIAEEK